MAKWEKFLRTDGVCSVYGMAVGGVLGVMLLVGLFCVKLAMADGTVYLRNLMPPGSAACAEQIETDGAAQREQQLIDKLHQDDQDIVYEVIKNDARWRVVRMRVTAYCPCPVCCGRFADGMTACNHRIEQGDVFVAADKMYRFGTEMIIPGYNGNRAVQVKDRGRVIVGNRLDVFFNSHEVAKKWGVRHLDVLIREK